MQATVSNGRGQQITNLEREAFTVYENGTKEAISIFRHDVVPVSLGLLMDRSKSMRPHRREAEAAALSIIRSASPEDELFLIHFADKPALDVLMTREKEIMTKALRFGAVGGTALRDAMALGADYLTSHASNPRRVLVVVSDGDDNASNISVDAIKDVAEKNSIAIYAVGLLNLSDSDKAHRGREALSALTDRTGGVAAFPMTAEQSGEVMEDFSARMRHRYTIGYSPNLQALDGSYRRIKLVAKGLEKLRVDTRPGYQAKPAP